MGAETSDADRYMKRDKGLSISQMRQKGRQSKGVREARKE